MPVRLLKSCPSTSADIDVGKNIGATLQIDQANADKNIAQAKAEERRAMAIAAEQEMKAKAQEARAEVIQLKPKCPKLWHKPCATVTWVSWTTTNWKT